MQLIILGTYFSSPENTFLFIYFGFNIAEEIFIEDMSGIQIPLNTKQKDANLFLHRTYSFLQYWW